MEKNLLNDRLAEVGKIARASKFKRMLSNPFKYLYSIFFNKIIYPRTKRGKICKTNTFFNIPISIILPAGTDIYLTGGKTHESEIRLAQYLINNLNEGDQLIDIGAHYGYFSLLGSTLVGKSGKVFSFEASKETYKILVKNVDKFTNVNAFHKAINDKNAMIEFYEFPVLYSEYNSININQFKDQGWYNKFAPQKIMVEGISLDELVMQNNIIPKVIKIDVEGAEFKVVSGGLDTLKNKNIDLVIEFVSKERHNEEHHKAVDLLKSLGYKTHVISEEGTLLACDNIEKYLTTNNFESDNIVLCK